MPRSLCGHPIVNAGIGGASTASNLDSILTEALGGKRAALVVVSLGTNDAAISDSVEQYAVELPRAADRAGGADAAPRDGGDTASPRPAWRRAKKVSIAVIDSYNAILPELAKEASAAFIPLPAMPDAHTVDGIHLNAAGYEVWDRAILGGIESTLCKSS